MEDHLQPKLLKCLICEAEFDASQRNRGKGTQKYCSQKCYVRASNAKAYARRRTPLPPEALIRECVTCHTRFTAKPTTPDALTCSQKCNDARQNQLRRQATLAKQASVVKECLECGARFTPHRMTVGRQKFCSPKCSQRAAQRAWYERNVRTRNADGNRLKSKEWKAAKGAVLLRDGGKCACCGEVRPHQHVHHVAHRTEAERNDHSLDNLICLCGKCHSKIHDIRLGRDENGFVLSGIIFDMLGISEVTICPASE